MSGHQWTVTVVFVALAFSADPIARGQAGRQAPVTDSSSFDQRVASTIREAGQIRSASNVEIRSRVRGGTTILDVIPEGATVKEGDWLITLDSSRFESELERARLEYTSSMTNVIHAEAQLALAMKTLDRWKLLTELQKEASDLALAAIMGNDGEFELERTAAESERRVLAARLNLAEQLAAAWQEEHPDGKLSPEIQLALTEAEAGIERASKKLKFLEVQRKSVLANTKLELLQKQYEFENQRDEAETQIIIARSDLEAVRTQLKLRENELEEIQQVVDNCTIRSPASGTVVYARAQDRRGGSDFALKPGAMVRERQALLLLPDLSKLQLRTLVKEASIGAVSVGQSATVRIDAFPDQPVQGAVVKINQYSDAGGWQSDEKRYAVDIDLIAPPNGLRPGMTGQVEISVDGKAGR